MKPVVLSARLQAVAAMVTVGNRVCDVGCDHGFVPVYLVEQGISPAVLAMDVRSGPLNAAREHIAERGLEKNIETRLSDGLHNYNIGEADTLICAGMGGRLMMKILSDHEDKTESFRELILQPQSELEQFRAWLRGQGYRITDENMIEEDGKFYPMMRVETDDSTPGGATCSYTEICKELKRKAAYSCSTTLNNTCNYTDNIELCKLCDRYGSLLLFHKNRTLAAFLIREERIYNEILSELQARGLSDDKRKNRYEEVQVLLEDCRKALGIVKVDK